MKRIIVSLLVAGLAYVGMLQCVGSFGLTRKWHGFVRSFGNKWISEIVFLITVIIPVYQICMLVDAILLNLIEFWGGSNPVSYDENGEHKKVAVKGDERVEFTYKKFGAEMEVRAFKNGNLVKHLLLKKNQPGVVFGMKDGEWQKIDVKEADIEGLKLVRVEQGGELIKSQVYTSAEYRNLRNGFVTKSGNRVYANIPAPGSTF